MKKKFNKKLVWLLVLTLLLCIIPAAYVLAKTVAAQEAETVFFYIEQFATFGEIPAR
jgi:PDZ domain-containing secreted protein